MLPMARTESLRSGLGTAPLPAIAHPATTNPHTTTRSPTSDTTRQPAIRHTWHGDSSGAATATARAAAATRLLLAADLGGDGRYRERHHHPERREEARRGRVATARAQGAASTAATSWPLPALRSAVNSAAAAPLPDLRHAAGVAVALHARHALVVGRRAGRAYTLRITSPARPPSNQRRPCQPLDVAAPRAGNRPRLLRTHGCAPAHHPRHRACRNRLRPRASTRPHRHPQRRPPWPRATPDLTAISTGGPFAPPSVAELLVPTPTRGFLQHSRKHTQL